MSHAPAARRTRLFALAVALVAAAGGTGLLGSAAAATTTVVRTGDPGLRETWANAPFGSGGNYLAVTDAWGMSETLSLTAGSGGATVSLYGVLAPDGGLADVYVDGVRQPARSSFYAALADPANGTVQPVLSAPISLGPGRHTVRVVATGLRDPASVGSWVRIDSWAVTDGGVSRTYQEAARDTADAVHRVTDAFPHVVATDSARRLAAYAPQVAATGVTPPRWTTTVSGAKVAFRLCRGPAGGTATLAVDRYTKQVSLYQPFTSCGTPVAVWTGPRGSHAVSISVDGTSPTGSAGTRVGFDALLVD